MLTLIPTVAAQCGKGVVPVNVDWNRIVDQNYQVRMAGIDGHSRITKNRTCAVAYFTLLYLEEKTSFITLIASSSYNHCIQLTSAVSIVAKSSDASNTSLASYAWLIIAAGRPNRAVGTQCAATRYSTFHPILDNYNVLVARTAIGATAEAELTAAQGRLNLVIPVQFRHPCSSP
ncbi:hypothetical protein HDU96_008433 [Phlyctochytrium bullatum]|nr:hypothetical protein HDU96_008433 [Phlyctochytrium bullatum]